MEKEVRGRRGGRNRPGEMQQIGEEVPSSDPDTLEQGLKAKCFRNWPYIINGWSDPVTRKQGVEGTEAKYRAYGKKNPLV